MYQGFKNRNLEQRIIIPIKPKPFIMPTIEERFGELADDSLIDHLRKVVVFLNDAVETEENIEDKLCFRTLVINGNYDSTEQGDFQIILEMVLKRKNFLKDEEIQIVTDQDEKLETYQDALRKIVDIDNNIENTAFYNIQQIAREALGI